MKHVGRYQIVQELGRGGMGVVYEVRHPGTPERLALKMILTPDPEGLERFRREAEILRWLGRHPHIVGFRDSGVEQGHPYIVMDFVEGRTLQAALSEGLSRADGLRVLSEIAGALHFAHEAGVVHRDLKPENVLLTAEGRALLSDFGVAKNLQGDRLTITGEVLGTPAYMAPEQLDGSPAVDRRADVYALGAVLYQILAGRVPFEGDKISAAKSILIDPPRPPSEHDPSASPALEALCLEALAKDPHDRPQTAEAFARRLEPVRGGPVAARGGWGRALALAIPLALVTGGATWALSNRRDTPAPAATPQPQPPAWEESREAAAAYLLDRARATNTTDLASARRVLRWIERARQVAFPEVLQRGPELIPLLLARSEAVLAASKPAAREHVAQVGEAQRALVLWRLLAGKTPLPTPLRDHLLRLVSSPIPALRHAAEPWRKVMEDSPFLEGVERGLALEVGEAERRAIQTRRAETYPRPWGALVMELNRRAEVPGSLFASWTLHQALTSLLVRRTDLRFLWYDAATTAFTSGVREEGRLLARVFVEEARAQESESNPFYFLARHMVLCGAPRDAVEYSDIALRNRIEASRKKPNDSYGWVAMLAARTRIDSGRPEDAKRILFPLADDRLLRRNWYHWEYRRRIGLALGDREVTATARRKVEELKPISRRELLTRRWGNKLKYP